MVVRLGDRSWFGDAVRLVAGVSWISTGPAGSPSTKCQRARKNVDAE
jgi:hypothetical protein